MSRPRRLMLRASLLTGFWLGQAVLVYIAAAVWFTSMDQVDHATNPWGAFAWSDLLEMVSLAEFNFWCLTAILAMTALQAIFVWPVRAPGPAAERGWPIWVSLAVAGACISVLSLAAVSTAIYMGEQAGLSVAPIIGNGVTWFAIAWLACSWLAATPLLIAFCRRRGRTPREALLGRVASLIFLGTLVETAAIIPLDVMIRRRESCYCFAGTFWSLTLCGSVGVVVFGPAILLPLLARRRKRWYAGRCDFCGYDMTGCPAAARCPECGAGWAAEGGLPSAPSTHALTDHTPPLPPASTRL